MPAMRSAGTDTDCHRDLDYDGPANAGGVEHDGSDRRAMPAS